ncbi:MAG: hypothetical protein LUF32_05345 [Clostridiales bacterium]|nr:hypothetical protein [Clostridiales bacterium]
MERHDQDSRLMTAADINLCVGLMGRAGWNDFPILKSEQSLEQQMIDSVLRLEKAGCVVWDRDRWKLTEEISDIFSRIAWPRIVYRFRSQSSPPKTLYCDDGGAILFEQVFGELQTGRITRAADVDPETLLLDFVREEAQEEPLWDRDALRLLFLESKTGRRYPRAKTILFIESEGGRKREYAFFYENGVLKAADAEGRVCDYSRESIFD